MITCRFTPLFRLGNWISMAHIQETAVDAVLVARPYLQLRLFTVVLEFHRTGQKLVPAPVPVETSE